MAVHNPPLWQQNRTDHTAENERSLTRGLFPQVGVLAVPNGSLQVAQSGTPGMNVQVAAGVCAVSGTTTSNQGVYVGWNDAALAVTISTADATNPRRDLIVARIRDSFYSGGTDSFAIEVVTGTPAASPADPAVPASSIVLARVAVAANATSILNASITDLRTLITTLGGQLVVPTASMLPSVGLYNGLEAYVQDVKHNVSYNGTNWVELATARICTITNPYLLTTTWATVTGATLTLPPGSWVIYAKGNDVQTGTASQIDFRIQNTTDGTTVDIVSNFAATPHRLPYALEGAVTITATKTFALQAQIGALSSAPSTDNNTFFAVSVTALA